MEFGVQKPFVWSGQTPRFAVTAMPATAVTSVARTRKCRRREESGHQYHPRAGRPGGTASMRGRTSTSMGGQLLAPQRDVADGDPHHDEGQDELRVRVPEPADLVRYPPVHNGRAPRALCRTGWLWRFGIRNVPEPGDYGGKQAQMPCGEDPPPIVSRDGNLGVEEGLEVWRGWLSEVGALVCPSVVGAPEARASTLGVCIVVRVNLCGAIALQGPEGPGEFDYHAEVSEGTGDWGRCDESMCCSGKVHVSEGVGYPYRVNLLVRASAASLPVPLFQRSVPRNPAPGARRSSMQTPKTRPENVSLGPESDSQPTATQDRAKLREVVAKLMGAVQEEDWLTHTRAHPICGLVRGARRLGGTATIGQPAC
ncbi:predicted protein [Chaetomium globosum CBS 148.51]|uniref:Uncharacterized protein n=1 Tax=Chaetomium globosum (strain ATCC 6205 / CBS 148.51 / DSM 1962 / NBRC 6347 / NRRL 1970) TaxID=306901 RepID=Q2GT64_CHAGB|nr:uncharacterized protein CHGG_08840 [Chaetomium globosum CBS 148.51]EAQ84826.1 predicted protein [Chaetomium globosum CBS 148.51]